MSRHLISIDQFSGSAGALRREFERRFADARSATAGRFVWDHWHVPDQYTLLRTPAYHVFPEKLYTRWHTQLVNWGRLVLGCHDVSPPWLSCYVDGCGQELHADHPHGPWAFVFSLSPKAMKFKGGETQIMKPEFLSGWAGNRRPTTELEDMFTLIKPKQNRLIVFDPRLPHGVRQVSGVHGVLDGRLVIHGWFVQPRPFFYGPLKESTVAMVLDETLGLVGREMAREDVTGYVSLRLRVSPAGRVSSLQWLTNSLVGDASCLRRAKRCMSARFGGARFPRARRSTLLTVPVRFGL